MRQPGSTFSCLETSQTGDSAGFQVSLSQNQSWLSTVRAILISIFCTFFPFLDLPVFWPILVLYFIMLFTLMMKRQIKHMIKYRYVPFSYGKPKHTGNNNKEA
ncbi:protein RER1 homolog, partial [Clonorchis sinensis]